MNISLFQSFWHKNRGLKNPRYIRKKILFPPWNWGCSLMSERGRSNICYRGEKTWSNGGSPIKIGSRILSEPIKNELKSATYFLIEERESRLFSPRLILSPTKIVYPVFKLKLTNFDIKLMFTKQNICSLIIFKFIECIFIIVSISEKILLCHSL